MGFVPEDRHRRGLVLDYSVADNLILGIHGSKPFVRRGLRNQAKIGEHAEELIKKYDVRPPVASQAVRNLSGGNQQKVVVAREFAQNPDPLICSQPTCGGCGGHRVHPPASDCPKDQGAAVLLVSAELDEVLSLSDRVAVMYNGEIVSVMPIEEATEHKLGFLMLGGRPEEYDAGEVSVNADQD